MRYTGMRVSDAVAFSTDRLDGKRLFLYAQKTGVPVYTVLPDSILEVLEATPRVTDTRYFWTGNGERQTAVCDWQGKIKDVFDAAGISKGMGNAVSHRFRDTLPSSCFSPVFLSNVSPLSWDIKASASPGSITTVGCARGRSS